MLLLLWCVPPLLVVAYWWMLRRRKRAAVRYASLDLIRPALGRGARWRRHVPPLLFLLAIATLAFGLARPETRMTLPSVHQTVILAIDVSLSMSADDVDPNRLTAAQVAARAFVLDRPADLRVGLVAFGGNAIVVQQPTSNREDLLAAIDRFQLQRGTATGSALYAALATLLPDIGVDLQALEFKWENVRNPRDASQFAMKEPAMKAAQPVPPGSYDHGAIILMSDGKSTIGRRRSTRRARSPRAACACSRSDSARPKARWCAATGGRCSSANAAATTPYFEVCCMAPLLRRARLPGFGCGALDHDDQALEQEEQHARRRAAGS